MKNSISSKLKSILEKGENQKVEFKESVDSGLDKEMVAFANSEGGKIYYIGVTDKGKIKPRNIRGWRFLLRKVVKDFQRN